MLDKKINDKKLEDVNGGFLNLNSDPKEKGYWYVLTYSAKWRTVDQKGGFATAEERDAALEQAKAKAVAEGGEYINWRVGYNA